MKKILLFTAIYLALCLSVSLAQGTAPSKYSVLIDESLQGEESDPNVGAAWLGYALSHANWIEDNYKDKDLAKDYKLSFDEEVFCRDNLAQIWSELKAKHPGIKDDYLDGLLKIRDAGFLKEYIWTFHKQKDWSEPEGLKQKDFNGWMEKNLPGFQPKTLTGLQIGED